MAKKKKKGNPIIVGLIIVGGSIAALWQNEHRFDYHKAASETIVVEQVSSLERDSIFSHTDGMDQSLVLDGEYVQEFSGYLQIKRQAEIYAWDRDEDSDGDVTWSKRWMSNLESNNRNRNLTKELRSRTFKPVNYEVGELNVDSNEIQFVDESETILPERLQLTSKGDQKRLKIKGKYFYHAKGRVSVDTQLGDERLSFFAVPIPKTATYFGRWNGLTAVKHQAEVKKGIISKIIKDIGILHHLVAGERTIALKTIKSHIEKLKKYVRMIGLAAITIGGGMFFSGLTKFLLFIPFVGNAISTVSGWVGMLLGFVIGVFTIALAFTSSHPLFMVSLVLCIGIGVYFLRSNAQKKQSRLREQLSKELGYSPSDEEMKELEYIKLCQLFASDGHISRDEQKRLDRWAKRNRFSSYKVKDLVRRAKKEISQQGDKLESLKSLIKLSLADGSIDKKEHKTLLQAASFVGIQRRELSKLIDQVQTV